MTADVQSWGTNSRAGNEDSFPSCVGNRPSRPKNQNPHAKAEAAKKTADTFRHIFE